MNIQSSFDNVWVCLFCSTLFRASNFTSPILRSSSRSAWGKRSWQQDHKSDTVTRLDLGSRLTTANLQLFSKQGQLKRMPPKVDPVSTPINGWKRFISVTVEELNKFGTLHQLWWNQQLQVAQSFRLSARNSRTGWWFRKACPSLLDSAGPAGRLETFEFQVLCHSNLRETNFPPRPRSDTNKSTSKRKIRKTDENWFRRFDGCSQLQPVAALQFQP